MKIALLTSSQEQDTYPDEQPFIQELKNQNIDFSWIVWNKKNIDWNQFDKVIIRTTWDYQSNYKQFLEVLSHIEQSQACLQNPLETIKWNVDKKYLFELQEAGINIIPTTIVDEVDQTFLRINNQKTMVLKPTVSASAYDTFKINESNLRENLPAIKETLQRKTMMAQPFVSEIVTEGEYSLFYFKGRFSHAVCKKPKEGDFRSQEQYGSFVCSISPEQELLDIAKKLMELKCQELLYTRIDFVRYNGQFCIMEVELIEPSLYFMHSKHASHNFIKAIKQ